MTTYIAKETIQRLLKDVRHIIKNPLTDQGIYYIHDDTDMMKGYAMIIGPVDTPYFGGFYFFEFTYPVDYPHSPPKVKYSLMVIIFVLILTYIAAVKCVFPS